MAGKERDALRKLAVFRGGFTAPAAQTVTQASWELLDTLVMQSLVEVDPDPEEPRYRLLEPIRQFAWALSDAAERDAIERRHAAWVVGLAKQASREVLLDQARWTERLEAEHANIETAIEWSLATPGDQSALRIAGYLGYDWFSTGHGEALDWVERASREPGERHPASVPAPS